MLSNGLQTVPRHGEVASSVYLGTQDMFDASQKVVCLENEHQLSWDCVQELCDFCQEGWEVASNLTQLKE